MTVSGDTHGILGMAGEYGLRDRKWINHQSTFSSVTCTNVRGSHAALKVSQRLLRGQEVVVLVFEVVQLQVASPVQPQKLVPCGQDGKTRQTMKMNQPSIRTQQDTPTPPNTAGPTGCQSNTRLFVARQQSTVSMLC